MSFETAELLAELPKLRSYARKLDYQNWEDLVQETVSRALNKSHLFQPGSNLGGWLSAILHNAFMNRMRKSSFKNEIGVDYIADLEGASDGAQEATVELKAAMAAIENLPATQRSVILRRLDFDTDEDMAEALCMAHSTVKSQLSRARAALSQALEGMHL